MCKTAVEIDASAHLARIAVGDIDKSSLIVRIARTEDNDLHTVVEHFLKHIEQEIKALLIDKTRDHCAKRRTWIYFQFELLLQ